MHSFDSFIRPLQPTCGMLETVARLRGTLWAGEGQRRSAAAADPGLWWGLPRPASRDHRPDDPCRPVSLVRLVPAWKERGGSAGATCVLRNLKPIENTLGTSFDEQTNDTLSRVGHSLLLRPKTHSFR